MRAAPPATVILDNEAVVALSDARHAKHRALLPYVEGVAQRRSRRAVPQVLVPVAVRIEAGWDRGHPAAAIINRVSGARDVALSGPVADAAHRLRAVTGVSVVDATVGQAAAEAPKPVVILSSDTEDMTRLADVVDGDVRIVRV